MNATTDLSFLDRLNPSQREAVEYVDGPSLVIAGAGSGKTMVLTYKIAYLLMSGMRPYHILALTFTNKAAREMKTRVGLLVGDLEASSLWMGTFHSIFNRILRKEAGVFGFTPDYTIYQPSDSKSLVKSILKERNLDEKTYKIGTILNRISEAKNALVTPSEYTQSRETLQRDSNANMPLLHEIYASYCMRCHQANAMDFDDLLLFTYKLFAEYPETCQRYAKRFEYILVDEYQDTNYAQHKILIQLSQLNKKICVVGDDAQSIYSFRGANIENILQFQDLYNGTRLFKLEQNYRSTRNIVGAANSLIEKNTRQIPKKIYSENEDGARISLKHAFSDVEEGEIVSNEISRLVRKEHLKYEQIAILYRTNSQSRIFEEALRKHAIPYRIYGGFSFYDQKLIKDILAYFRLIVNANDEEAFKRIVNYPTRGIGNVTINKVLQAASEHQVGVWKVMQSPRTFGVDVNNGTLSKLNGFYDLIERFRDSHVDAYTLGARVLNESGIMQEAYKDTSLESKEMQDNLSELLNGMSTFVSMQRETGDERIYMSDYLSEVALLSDTDDQETEGEDRVTMMTVHSSKGLEFDAVFIVGMEEELFPNQMAMFSQKELEEERRLFYVAITRAKNRCYLSCAKSRYRFGQMDFYQPSRFLKEIDARYINDDSKTALPGFTSRKDFSMPLFKKAPAFSPTPQPASMKRINVHQDKESTTLETALINQQPCVVGTMVEHDRFGVGEIKAFSGTPDNVTATILFQNVGEKKLLLKYAKLNIMQ